MGKKLENLPLIPLRGITVFPNMVLHFDVGREKSIAAVEKAMLDNQRIFLLTQKQAKVELPERDDLFEVGTICTIKQMVKMPKNNIRVLVEGIDRATLVSIKENEDYTEVEVEKFIEEQEVDTETEALIRMLQDEFEKYAELTGVETEEFFTETEDSKPGSLVDSIASYIILKQEDRQRVLEIFDVNKRIEEVIIFIKNEIELVKLEKMIGYNVKKKLDKNQKEYYLREQLKIIQEELGEENQEKKEIEEYGVKIKKAKLPKKVKDVADYELKRLKSSEMHSSESSVIKTYLDWVLSIPWNKSTKDNLDMKVVSDVLDKEHYALEDVKDRIIEYLAVKKKVNSLKGPILCLVGPPGVGKTSIAKSVAKALNRNFVRISLGGLRDEAEIRGHRRTYVGAIPGRLAYGLKEAKSNNPVFLLDEIDKMSQDFKGNPADALLEILDSEQNKDFRDNYMELNLDLSNILFITTANTLDTIPEPLRDRMEIIEVSGYTYEEKFHIAKKYLIPRQLQENGATSDEVVINDSALKVIIENYTRESGVRSLERTIGRLIRKCIKDMMINNKSKISINASSLEKYLGQKKVTYDKINQQNRIGVVRGLAWTVYGGDTLDVEAIIMQGTGKLELTGKLGDVMKESAKAAYTYVRANAKEYGIDETFYKDKDIHIHVPEGAVPKDGPSAGVTIVTALVSALSNKPVKFNVAMTGEVTLTGRVLPIGGLKEKSLAAFRAGVDTIIVPKENERDAKKLPQSIKNKLKIIFAEKIDDVLKNALCGVDNNEN